MTVRSAHARRHLAAALIALCLAATIDAGSARGAEQRLVVSVADDTAYPTMRLIVACPFEVYEDGGTPSFTVVENGSARAVDDVRPASVEREPVDVAVLIDTSGSMRGVALEQAKRAARAFLDELDAADTVTLVAFSSTPRVVLARSQDRDALSRAVSGLEAGGETAVHDAVVLASRTLGTEEGRRRAIVLLSDGGDTVSGATLDAAVRAVAQTHAPVYAVALKTREFDSRSLEALARGSGGRFLTVSDVSQLSMLYAGIARELANQFELTYTSEAPDEPQLVIQVAAQLGAARAEGSVVVPNPSFVAAAGQPAPLTEPRPMRPLLALSLIATFAAVALIANTALSPLAMRGASIKRVTLYDQVRNGERQRTARGSDERRSGILGIVEEVAGRRGLTSVINQKLERAGLPLRASEYMTIHVFTVVIIGLVVRALAGSLTAAVLAVLLAVALPLLLLEYLIQKRREAFEEQLPDVLSLIAGSLRAGWGLMQAIGVVVEQMPEPSSVEFKRVQTETRLGFPVVEALHRMADRLGSDDFRWVVTAIGIQREVGGNLAEILDIVASTMRERAELARHIRALTAEGRLSGIILIALPFLELVALLIINPSYMSGMFTSPVGLFLAAAGLVLLLVGALWLHSIVRVEV